MSKPDPAPQPATTKPRKKRCPMPEEHKRKLSKAMRGNTNAAGHKINPASLAALEGKRGTGKTNPRSLKNLMQFRAAKRKRRRARRADTK